MPKLTPETEELPRRCCPECGAPWEQGGRSADSRTIGWRPTCHCGHEYGPSGEYGGGGPLAPVPFGDELLVRKTE